MQRTEWKLKKKSDTIKWNIFQNNYIGCSTSSLQIDNKSKGQLLQQTMSGRNGHKMQNDLINFKLLHSIGATIWFESQIDSIKCFHLLPWSLKEDIGPKLPNFMICVKMKYTHLIFVTNITNEICGEKFVMWRNFRSLHICNVEKYEITQHVEKFQISSHLSWI